MRSWYGVHMRATVRPMSSSPSTVSSGDNAAFLRRLIMLPIAAGLILVVEMP